MTRQERVQALINRYPQAKGPPKRTSSILVPTSQAAYELGLSAEQFRRIAKKYKIEPNDFCTNPRYPAGPRLLLWASDRIDLIGATEEASSARKRNQERASAEGSRTANGTSSSPIGFSSGPQVLPRSSA
jgi:hypothetical protein